jgi:DNA-binding IclR family transcriptional regulator
MEPSDGGERRKTTATSLRVVDAVDALGGATLSEIASHTGLSSSTVHTHLRTLEDCEYVRRIDGTYHLGLKLFHLGEKARYRDDRYRVAKERAFELADTVNEEVSFAVEEYGRSIILFDETTNPATDGYQVGRYFYMHNSASGKVMLAEYPEDRIHAILDRWGMPRQTDNTIQDRAELLAELDRVRDQGYAVNRQEALEGLRSVAVAVTTPDGDVLGSLDISGPPYRLPEDEELAALLRPAVADIEAAIQSSGSDAPDA